VLEDRMKELTLIKTRTKLKSVEEIIKMIVVMSLAGAGIFIPDLRVFSCAVVIGMVAEMIPKYYHKVEEEVILPIVGKVK
jgi:hypothetical protein